MALNYEAFFVIKRFFCEVTRAYCSFKIRPVPVGHPVYIIMTFETQLIGKKLMFRGDEKMT
jgi:hypothetical protein